MITPRDEIRHLKSYSPPLEGRVDKLRLDFNENVKGCSPNVLKALNTITLEQISAYPEYDVFRDKLASYLGVKSENITLSSGTDEGIKLVFDAYLDKNEEIILPVPTFSMFEFYAQRIGAKIRKILYNDDLSFPVDEVLKALKSNPKMVILVNPNNPTGTVITEQNIIRIVERARNSLVLLDEAYVQFLGESMLDTVLRYDNVVILRTFSKVFGLAGLRLGVIISNKNTTETLRKVNSPYNVSSLSCILASAALDDIKFVDGYVNEIITQRNRVSNAINDLGYHAFPSGANFILVNFDSKAQFILRALHQHDILVRDRSGYPLLKGCVRITLGPANVMDHLLKTLQKIDNRPAIIFDMDGVLVDVSGSYRKTIQLTVERFLETNINPEEIQALKEQGGFNNDWKLTQELINQGGMYPGIDDIKEVFQDYYLGGEKQPGLIDNEIWLLPISILEALRQQYPMAIFTGRPRREAMYVLEKHNVGHLFDFVVTMDDLPRDKGKPHPYGLVKIMKELHLTSGWYFGDTIDDMKAAKNADIVPIGVIPPQIRNTTLASRLLDAGAEQILKSISDIKEVIQ